MKKSTTPTFLVELPLRVDEGQAKRLRANFEAARCLYNALLGEAMKRLRAMRADPAWQEARALPHAHKQERKEAFARLRHAYGFSEYALINFAKDANCAWIRDHIDAVMAQRLAARAYGAVGRVCLGKAKKVRFKSRGRGLDSVENNRNDTGLRFLLQPSEEGNHGWLIWGKDRLTALIDWNDPVVHHGLRHRIKYARLVRRKASGPKAQGADAQGYRYYVQLALEGLPHRKPKHTVGIDVVGLDLGPSTIAIVKNSKGYLASRRRIAHKERKLAAHRKSLHGRLVHQIIRVGNTIRTEKLSYKAWLKQYGKSVGRNAPGMLIDQLRRMVASTGGTLSEFPTRSTKLSQYCHGCKTYVKKPLSQRWHSCACGVGPVQRDLYSAWLAAHLNFPDTIPSTAHDEWEGADLRLLAAVEVLQQRANEGQSLRRPRGHPPRQSASARKTCAEPTRASLPTRQAGSVGVRSRASCYRRETVSL